MCALCNEFCCLFLKTNFDFVKILFRKGPIWHKQQSKLTKSVQNLCKPWFKHNHFHRSSMLSSNPGVVYVEHALASLTFGVLVEKCPLYPMVTLKERRSHSPFKALQLFLPQLFTCVDEDLCGKLENLWLLLRVCSSSGI